MTPRRRQVLIGLTAGLACAPLLPGAPGGWPSATALSAALGIGCALGFRGPRRSSEAALSGAALGAAVWVLAGVALFPALAGGGPLWSATGMRGRFPELAGWLLFGAALVAGVEALRRLVERVLGAEETT